MTINATDIKLLASERMADTSDGGGRRTGNVIPDGVPGNIFPKVSRLDSVYGRFNMRKIYGAVSTANIDTYAGAHAVIMDAPDNERIHAALFSTGSDFDDRTAARDRIESYVIAGPESRMVLYGRQLVGQGAIQVYQKPEEALPEVGDVYCLSKEAGVVTEYQQFVRITDVTHEVRTLTDEKGDFKARILGLKIGSPLRYEFAGPLVPDRLSNVTRSSMVRLTTVADASRYFGIRKVTEAAAEGDLTLRLDSIYTPIVPTTNRETALSNVDMLGASSLVDSASSTLPFGHMGAINISNATVKCPFRLKPGSVHVVWRSSGSPYQSVDQVAYVDNGDGTATRVIGQPFFALAPATMTIDYEAGLLKFSAANFSNLTYNLFLRATPTAVVDRPAHSRNVPVTLATRGTVYAETLLPAPAPGTLVVAFRSLGRWYTLRDDGKGVAKGADAAYGTGSVDYMSGASVVTLGALPDVGSALIFSWGSSVHVTPRDRVVVEPPVWRHQLPDTAVEPGSVTVSWDVTLRNAQGDVTGTLPQSLTDDGAGKLTGDGVGRIVYATGAMWFLPKLLPDPGSTPFIEYEKSETIEQAFTPAMDGNGMVSVTLTDGPAVPGTVTLLWQTIRDKTVEEKSGSSVSNVVYHVIPEPQPPVVVSPSGGPGGGPVIEVQPPPVVVSPGVEPPPDITVTPGVTPVTPTPPAPLGPTYPLIGATLNNALGLPVVFQPYNGAVPPQATYEVDVASGKFVVPIPASQTTWGGVTIADSDRLPTLQGWTAPPPTVYGGGAILLPGGEIIYGNGGDAPAGSYVSAY